MMQTQNRSARMERGFDRMVSEFGQPIGLDQRYTAAGVYDKLGMLVVLALLAGVVGYATDNVLLLIGGIVVGLIVGLIGLLRPATAKYMAPLYAIAEGAALGALTGLYATTAGDGIVPMAIIFTGGIFLAALVIFRSGLVKVTPRFVSMTMMAGFGFLLVVLASAFGMPGLGGAGGDLVIGIIGVLIGVFYLFIDFNYIQVAESRQLPVEGEWTGALMLMMSLVFVYINVLRILGRRR